MRFDEVLRNPAVRRAIAAGEEQVGKVVGRLLANDRVTTGLQTLITSAVQARHTFERGVRGALHAANLPSTDDVAALKKRLDDLETTLDGLAARVAAKGRAPRGEG